MDKYLNKDDEVRAFDTREEVAEYLKFRNEHDEWIADTISSLSCYAIDPKIPIFWDSRKTGVTRMTKRGYKLPMDDIVTDDTEEGKTNQECIETFGMFLCVLHGCGTFRPIPCDERAFSSIIQRAGDECGTMTRVNESPKKSVLPIEEKADRIARDFFLYEGGAQILVRDGKCRFVASDQYTIADNESLVLALEEVLAQDHPDMEFVQGAVSHDYLALKWKLHDRMQEESLRLRLNDAGANIQELTSGVTFVTSDVGKSSVRALVNFVIDGKEITLAGVAIDHKVEELNEEFKEGLQKFNELMKESEEVIEALGNTDIADVAFVVKEITDHYTAIFPKKATEEVLGEIPIRYPAGVGGTAMDAYLLLVEIIDRFTRSEKPTLARSLELSEKVSRLMHLPFDKIAAGGYEFPKQKN